VKGSVGDVFAVGTVCVEELRSATTTSSMDPANGDAYSKQSELATHMSIGLAISHLPWVDRRCHDRDLDRP
jgi:hypothetical protein